MTRRIRRRSRLTVGAVLGALLVGGAPSAWPVDTVRAGLAARSCAAVRPLALREVARLQRFTAWLRATGSQGYVGEVGWPGTTDPLAWDYVAQAWYSAADAAGLWVTAWSAARWWPADYPMAVYRLGRHGTDSRRGPQAVVIEAHPGRDGVLRGVDLAGGAFRTGDDGDTAFGNRSPGRYGIDYYYETAAQYRYLAARGVTAVRLAFRWERLQPVLGQDLDPAAVARLRATLRDAHLAGLAVVLDLHNFGGYWAQGPDGRQRLALGGPGLPVAALGDFWARLVRALSGVPGIAALGLMNEPRQLAARPDDGARVWEAASQQAVAAIRAQGDRHVVAVEAYAGDAPEQFTRFHPRAWITDPLHAVRYEVHQYFDEDGSGSYPHSASAEAARANAVAATSGRAPDGPVSSCTGHSIGGES